MRRESHHQGAEIDCALTDENFSPKNQDSMIIYGTDLVFKSEVDSIHEHGSEG